AVGERPARAERGARAARDPEPPARPARRVPVLRRAHARGDRRGDGRLGAYGEARLDARAHVAVRDARPGGCGGRDRAVRELAMEDLTPDRWQRIDRLFEAALDEPPDRRLGWLARACEGGQALYDAVARLLAKVETAEKAL